MTEVGREKKIRYIMLTLIKGLGPVSLNVLLDMCGSIENCFGMDEDELRTHDDMKKLGAKRIRSFVDQKESAELRNRAEKILSNAESCGIDVVTREDSSFPKRFIGLSDMPIVIYTKGKLIINDYAASAGIIGARRCTQEGKLEAIEKANSALADGRAVISGMAKGIDSYAHTAAIKAGGYTIAVLGNGADVCYPKEHQALYDKIASSGCIISEYPPGTQPRVYTFPRRNRLIAALSDELYVIDAGRHSGTRTTVEKWEEYEKGVKAV